MSIRIPAFSDISGHQEVIVYEEDSDGIFRMTGNHPLGLLEKHIEGLGARVGELVSDRFDIKEHKWSTPTVKCETGKEYSYYQFLRESLKKKKMIIVNVPDRHGSIQKFDLHELVFTQETSPDIQSRIMAKYAESADLYFKDGDAPVFLRAS